VNPDGIPPELPARFAPPAGLAWGTFTTSDGARLRYAHLGAAQPVAACVLAGGFAEFIEKYFETIADLVQAGLSVWCFDWRGQGRSTRPLRRPALARRRDFDRDAIDLIELATQLLPAQLPRMVIAHSMGGAISTLALSRAPDLFQAAVLSAPMYIIRTAPVPRFLARTVAGTAVAWGFGSAFAPGRGRWTRDLNLSQETSLTSHDPVRCTLQQAWFTAYPDLRVDGPTYAWVNAALALTSRVLAPEALMRIKLPVLIGCPGDEHFVEPDGARQALALLPRAALVPYARARHELFLERDAIRNDWLAEIARFVRHVLVRG
jgi:lysophospholipase